MSLRKEQKSSNSVKFDLIIISILDIIFDILIDICTKIKNEPFLHLYEKKFIEDLLVDNGNRLKSMEDPTNPLYHLLKISKKIDPTNHQLLANLITACAKLIKLNNEEIRYETFTRPSKKSCTYAVLFDNHLSDIPLVMGTFNQLDSLWNRWTNKRIGPTKADIDTWKGHSPQERIVFNEIWDRVRRHFDSKRESIDTVFKKAEAELSDKEMMIKAIMSTLYTYCNKAMDYSSIINSLQKILQEFEEKPIRSVETPDDLKNMESIALKLKLFSTSPVWLNFYQRSFVKIGKREKKNT